MKVIYFKKNARSPFHIHAGSYYDCFYISDENIVLYKEQQGSFGSENYSFSNRAEILIEEAKIIAEGKTPSLGGVSFSDIKEFEYDSLKLRDLIQNTKLKVELEIKVKSGIEDILKQIK